MVYIVTLVVQLSLPKAGQEIAMIVVTAPTSNIGRQVLANLLTKQAPVRLIARDPSKLSEETRKAVEVIEGSHSEADVVSKAFQGAEAVFWLVPADPQAVDAHAAYVDFARPGCQAMKAEGVKRVVGISALGRGWPKDAGHVTGSLAMDDVIAATGVSFRGLACATFMDNIARQGESIKAKGVFFGATPSDMKAPTCATRDIARVAADLLLDSTWSGVGEVPILGPEDLSSNEMAATLTEVLGKPVSYQQMAMEDFKRMLTGRMSEGMAQAMVNMMTAKNEGMDDLVQRSMGPSTPTTFRMWCETVLRPALGS